MLNKSKNCHKKANFPGNTYSQDGNRKQAMKQMGSGMTPKTDLKKSVYY